MLLVVFCRVVLGWVLSAFERALYGLARMLGCLIMRGGGKQIQKGKRGSDYS